MNLKQIIGLVLLAIGVIMIVFAVHTMHSMTHAQEIARKIRGHGEMVYLAGGVIFALIGAAAAFFYRGKKR